MTLSIYFEVALIVNHTNEFKKEKFYWFKATVHESDTQKNYQYLFFWLETKLSITYSIFVIIKSIGGHKSVNR